MGLMATGTTALAATSIMEEAAAAVVVVAAPTKTVALLHRAVPTKLLLDLLGRLPISVQVLVQN